MLDGDNRIRLIIAGLVLAAIVVGYIIFSQRFSTNNTNRSVQQITPTPVLTTTPIPTPATLGQSTKEISSLPNTGFPVGLIAIFSASAAVAGYFLRRYPH